MALGDDPPQQLGAARRLTFWPMTQNVAEMPLLFRKSSSAAVSPGFGPSSKVSAATFPVPRAAASGVAVAPTAPPGTNVGSGVGVQVPPPPVVAVPVMTRSSTR